LGGDSGRDAAGLPCLAFSDDTASNGRFWRDNREVLDQLRDGDREAWNSVQQRLGHRDRELREATAE
jgi:hypothetical protein